MPCPALPRGPTTVTGTLMAQHAALPPAALRYYINTADGLRVPLALGCCSRHLPKAFAPGTRATLAGSYTLVRGWPTKFVVSRVVTVGAGSSTKFHAAAAASKTFRAAAASGAVTGLKPVMVYIVKICGGQPWKGVNTLPVPKDVMAVLYAGGDSVHGTWARCSHGLSGLDRTRTAILSIDAGCGIGIPT